MPLPLAAPPQRKPITSWRVSTTDAQSPHNTSGTLSSTTSKLMMLAAGLASVALVVGLAVGLTVRPSAAAAVATTPDTTTPSLAGLLSTVYLHPSNLATVTPCDATLPADVGCNVWWSRDDAWAAYTAHAPSDWAQLRASLGDSDRAAAILYFPAFLADAQAGRGTVPLQRLATVVEDCAAAGLEPMLFFGKPEYFGYGNVTQNRDVIRSMANRAYLLALLRTALAVPAVQQHVRFVSLYWLGGSWVCSGNLACTEAQVSNFSADVKAAVEGGSGSPSSPPSSPFSYLQHLDGPFWDGCWPQPCSTWNVNGYSPASLVSSGATGLFAESWVQGSLLGGIRKLLAEGVVAEDRLLLLTDVPNCDLHPGTNPCSTGALASDVAAWFNILDQSGCCSNGTSWGVWSGLDGGLLDNANFYGDVWANGTGLTAKGQLHRARALADVERRRRQGG
jgi:hypothetical protein